MKLLRMTGRQKGALRLVCKNTFIVEASELGLKPGTWPEAVAARNGPPLTRYDSTDERVVYRQPKGTPDQLVLTIVND